MSAPAPRESEKSSNPKPVQQPGGRTQTHVASTGRALLKEEVRRTEGIEEQEKLVEADSGPEPSPEVAAEIAAERQARNQCAPGADISLLAELVATEARVRPLINEIREASRATIAGCAATMKATAGEVVGWANRENKALIELFSEYAASLDGGEINGDILGVLSVLNMFNPAAKMKTIFSVVLTGAGFLARRYNSRLAEWRKSKVGAELTQTSMRVGGVGDAQLATWEEMFSGLADGSLDVAELSFQAGELNGLLRPLNNEAEELRTMCKTGGKPDPAVVALLKRTIDELKQVEVQARANLALMRSLPGQMAAENKAGLDRMKGRYIAWLAQQGAIKVRGRLYADQQSGANVLHITLDQVVAIEGLEASGVSAETAQTICTKPGRVLEAGGTLALSLDSVVHGHRAASAHSEGESGTPATHQGELHYRVGPKGIAGSDQGYGVSAARVESLLRSRQ